ncbi:MAG: transglutaminase, partial [Microbacterium sp.]
MSTTTDAASPTDSPPRVEPQVIAGAVFAVVIVVIAAVAAWPIYRSWHLGLLAGTSALVAGAIAVAAHRFRWSGWLVTGTLAAAFLILGVPLAVPSRLGGP